MSEETSLTRPSNRRAALSALSIASAASAITIFLVFINLGQYGSYNSWPTFYRFPMAYAPRVWLFAFQAALLAGGFVLLITGGFLVASRYGCKRYGLLLNACSHAASPLQFLWFCSALLFAGARPNMAWILGFLALTALAAIRLGYYWPAREEDRSPTDRDTNQEELPGQSEALPRVSRGIWTSLAVTCALFIAVFSALTIRQYHAGNYGYADSGFVAEALWNTLHGRFMYAHGFDPPMLLADHFSPVWLTLVPVYALAPRHETLIVVSAAVIASTAVPIFLLARHEWRDNRAALCLAVAFLLYPPAQHEVSSFSFGFQAEVIALPLLAAACYCMRRKQWKWFLCFVFLVLCCKETLAAAVFGLGLCVWLLEKDRKLGGAVMALAIVWLLGVTKVILPWLKGGSHYYQLGQFFGHLGESYSEIFVNVAGMLFHHPVETLSKVLPRVFHREVWMFLAQMLLPLAFVSLLSPAALAMGALHFSLMLVSHKVHMFSIFHHYKIALVVVPFFAAAVGLRLFIEERSWLHRLLEKVRPGTVSPRTTPPATRNALLRGACVGILIGAVMHCYYFGPTPLSKTFDAKLIAISKRSLALAKVKQRIGLDASVTTTHRAGAHFTDRKQLYCLPLPPAVDPEAVFTTDYVLIDTNDDWGDKGGEKARALIASLEARDDYRLSYQNHTFRLYEKIRPGRKE